MARSHHRILRALLLAYAACSLIHFIHNAEYLAEYPSLPASWSRADVYLAWIGMTAVGVSGWLLLSRGLALTGLIVLGVYAAFGLDSLGHYILAPMSAHTLAMNSTILAEVTSAACVLLEVARQIVQESRRAGGDAMRTEVTDKPDPADEEFVIAQTRAYNRQFAVRDVSPLCVFIRDDEGHIVGGLSGKTFWQYLEVSFLWVSESHRNAGHASRLMAAAESEAVRRGCRHALLDTFSFQALGFYQRLGYQEFGRLSGWSGKHERHYLHKDLPAGA